MKKMIWHESKMISAIGAAFSMLKFVVFSYCRESQSQNFQLFCFEVTYLVTACRWHFLTASIQGSRCECSSSSGKLFVSMKHNVQLELNRKQNVSTDTFSFIKG